MKQIRITTPRLELVALWAELARAAVGNRSKLAQMLDAAVPHEFPPEVMEDVMELFAQQLEADPELMGWWCWYFVLNPANSERQLIGAGGFNGYPHEDGTLLMGYSIIPSYEGQGYATEAVSGLLSWAFQQPQVTRVIAETFSDHRSSIRVMEKNGMEFGGEGSEAGVVQYEILRDRFLGRTNL